MFIKSLQMNFHTIQKWIENRQLPGRWETWVWILKQLHHDLLKDWHCTGLKKEMTKHKRAQSVIQKSVEILLSQCEKSKMIHTFNYIDGLSVNVGLLTVLKYKYLLLQNDPCQSVTLLLMHHCVSSSILMFWRVVARILQQSTLYCM